MKKFIILFSVLFLASCGQNATQAENQNISENQKTETTKIEEKFDRKDEIVK